MPNSPRRFAEFWPHYVLTHRQPLTRGFHLVGTAAGWGLLAGAIYLQKPWLVLAAFVAPYAMAWFSHLIFERNLPASFEHPLWSFWAGQKMLALSLTGKMGEEMRRYSGKP